MTISEPHIDLLSFYLMLAAIAPSLISFSLGMLMPPRFARPMPLVATLLATMSAALMITLFTTSTSLVEISFPWFTVGEKTIHMSLLLDSSTRLMLTMVTVISLAVHVYSLGYMRADKKQQSYFAYLGLFSFSMTGMVLSGNLLVMFCFWELMGFCSYRLIGHWQEEQEAAEASIKAFIMNRAGDVGFIIGLMILWSAYGTLDLSLLTESTDVNILTIASLCIFLGVMGKSAQFPLFTWLPDAMAGPTPASAMIHAATMVAAGVFLLIRIDPLLTPVSLEVIGAVGAITCVLGATAALFQFNIKRILAYSTISQLGWMIMGIGSGEEQATLLHLINHGYFKAGLFLMAGSLIHSLHLVKPAGASEFDEQDIRNMGGLKNQMPFTFVCGLLCAASMGGVPLTSGFISKEMLLAHFSQPSGSATSYLIFAVAWAVTLLTPLYTFRLIWYVFFGKPSHAGIKEVSPVMYLPLGLLAFGSLGVNISIHPFRLRGWFDAFILKTSHTSIILAIVSTLLVALAVLAGYFLFRNKPAKVYSKIFYNGYFLDHLYKAFLIKPCLWIMEKTLKMDVRLWDGFIHIIAYMQTALAQVVAWIDHYLLDKIIVDGTARVMAGAGMAVRSTIKGRLQGYLLWALATLIIFILWFFLN